MFDDNVFNIEDVQKRHFLPGKIRVACLGNWCSTEYRSSGTTVSEETLRLSLKNIQSKNVRARRLAFVKQHDLSAYNEQNGTPRRFSLLQEAPKEHLEANTGAQSKG
nr:unnamed protein product [Spirometra erinaceieuropaei]